MKKLVIAIYSILFCGTAFAGTVSVQPFISGNDVTIAHLESLRSTFQNVINGSIEGGNQNIKAGSITSSDLTTAINIVTFRDEAFNDWTFSGMLATTSGTLSSTISAGVSYVNGVRIQTQATAHTFTASRDTYVYINAGGFFDYQEVSNGATAPATPANDLLLFKAVTDGSTVSSVADMRTTSIQIVVSTSNFATNYRDQAYVSRDSTVNFHVAPGTLAIGLTNYVQTSATTTKSIVTGTNWIEGNYPSGYVGRIFTYAFNNAGSGYDFKFSSADVAFSDTSSNSNGVLRYYSNGGTTYRAIGWGWLSADTVQTYQTSNLSDIGTQNYVSRTDLTQVSTSSTNFVNDGFSDIKFYSSGGFVTIDYLAGTDNSGSSQTVIGIMIDNQDMANTPRGNNGNTSSTEVHATYTTFRGILSRGIHTIQGRLKVSGSTGYINSRTMSARED